MGVYTKLFQNHSNYSDYRYSDDFLRPNVSKCIDESHVHYNPRIHVSGIIDTEQIATRLNRYLAAEGSIPVSGGGTVIDMVQTTTKTTSETPSLKWGPSVDPILPSTNCVCPDCSSMYYTNVGKVIKFSDGTNVSIEYNDPIYNGNDERIGDAYYLNYPIMIYDEDTEVYVDITTNNTVHSETHEGKEYIYLYYYQLTNSSGKTIWRTTNFSDQSLIILDDGTYVLEINPHSSELTSSICPPLQQFEHFLKMTIEYRNVCGYDRSKNIYYDNVPVIVLHQHYNYQPSHDPEEKPTEEDILELCEEYRTSFWDVDENVEIKNVVSTPIIGNKYVSGLDVSNYFREILIDGVDKKDEIVNQEGIYYFEPGIHSIDYVLNTGYKIRPETFTGVTFLDNVSIIKKITNIREEAFDFCQLVGTDEDTIRRICSVDDVEPIVVETEFDGPVLYNVSYQSSSGGIESPDYLLTTKGVDEASSLKSHMDDGSYVNNLPGVFYSDSEGYNQYYALMEESTGYVVGDKLCIGYIPKFSPYYPVTT